MKMVTLRHSRPPLDDGIEIRIRLAGQPGSKTNMVGRKERAVVESDVILDEQMLSKNISLQIVGSQKHSEINELRSCEKEFKKECNELTSGEEVTE